MKPLGKIGMQKNWIYEVIVSTFYGKKPHAAPIGIWTENFETLDMVIYEDSKTLKNILQENEFVVNFVDDVALFYDALFHKQQIAYQQSRQINAPVIKGSCAIVECKVKGIKEKENRFHIRAEIVGMEVKDEVRLINRAAGLVLESLILATRLPHFPGQGIEESIKEHYRVITKVAPDSRYENIIKKIIELLRLPIDLQGYAPLSTINKNETPH